MKKLQNKKGSKQSITTFIKHYYKDLDCFAIEDYQSDDLYTTLCNTAGALLQGKTVHVINATYSGNEARKQGIKLVDLIKELEEVMEKSK